MIKITHIKYTHFIKWWLVLLSVVLIQWPALGQPHFKVVPLGVYGGSTEGNLSAYMIAPAKDTAFVVLDAGTIYDGLKAASRHHVFTMSPLAFQRARIKGYLISHPHLDHVAGLILNAPQDSPKPIYGLDFTLEVLRNKYFTWSAWANFTDQGEAPTLNIYHYRTLHPAESTSLTGTQMSVTAYPLSHAMPGQSTAFLIRSGQGYFLYLGDCGDDRIEKGQRLQDLWKAVAPLLRTGQLKGISIECSYPDQQSDQQLFGHLKPGMVIRNLNLLDRLAGGTDTHHPIKDLPVIIAHIKPGGDREALIHEQLQQQNTLGVKLIFPKRGQEILL